MPRKCEPGCQCARHTHVIRTRYEKTCVECGQPFVAKRIDARFCSHGCYLKHDMREHGDQRRETARRWQQANRERRRETLRRFEERHGEQVKAEKRQRYAEVSADPEKSAERRAKSRQYYLDNRDRIRERARQRRAANHADRNRSAHGTEWAILFEELWAAQDGQCYLCGDPLDRNTARAIHLDHDHRCCPLGKSCERCRRGLACKDCNLIIGLARDSPAKLRLIADALERVLAEVDRRMLIPRQAREPVSRDLACQECGKPFTASRSDAMCCSSSCYERMRHRERNNGRHRRPAIPAVCKRCGAVFTTTRPEVAKYCTKRCSNAASVARRKAA